MTRLTALIIQQDENVYAMAYGPVENKFGFYIGTFDESPSGNMRPRDLLTSKPIYDDADMAQSAGSGVITQCRQDNSVLG